MNEIIQDILLKRSTMVVFGPQNMNIWILCRPSFTAQVGVFWCFFFLLILRSSLFLYIFQNHSKSIVSLHHRVSNKDNIFNDGIIVMQIANNFPKMKSCSFERSMNSNDCFFFQKYWQRIQFDGGRRW